MPLIYPDGHAGRYRLACDYLVGVAGHALTIPAGYAYDGASIPTLIGLTWVATYSPYEPCVMRAALVHDWLCDQRMPAIGYRTAAETFYRHLLADGAGRRRSWMMYQAVLRAGPRW